jgi:hypothetical protein
MTIPKTIIATVNQAVWLMLFLLPSHAASASKVLLDCLVNTDEATEKSEEDSNNGKSGEAIQIYINFDESYVLYNAHLLSAKERSRSSDPRNRDGNESEKIEGELTINTNSDEAIEASNDSSSFLYLKQESKFLYAWTSLIPSGNNTIQSFSATFSGSCSGPASME